MKYVTKKEVINSGVDIYLGNNWSETIIDVPGVEGRLLAEAVCINVRTGEHQTVDIRIMEPHKIRGEDCRRGLIKNVIVNCVKHLSEYKD